MFHRSPAGARRAPSLRLGRSLACGALLLLLTACISERREQELGDQMAATINAQIPLVHDPLLNAYLTRLGDRIAKVGDRPTLNYRFYIVNSSAVNAFALPGGHVYVTRGLLQRTRTGDELAGVLAHEIGHVVERHGVKKLQRHLRTGSVVGMLYELIFGGEPEILRQNALQLAGMLWSASHSREDEEEADRLAVEYMVRVGANPEGVVTLLETLLTEEERTDTSDLAAWFSSHPVTATRIAEAKQEIRSELERRGPSSSLKITAYPAFLRRVAALPPAPDAF